MAGLVAAIVGQAALGAVFGKAFAELYDSVKDVGSKVVMFKSILISFKSNLDLLAPVVKEIKRLNQELNRPEEETKSLIKDMEDAENLIRTCSEIQDWNFPFQAFYEEEHLPIWIRPLSGSVKFICKHRTEGIFCRFWRSSNLFGRKRSHPS